MRFITILSFTLLLAAPVVGQTSAVVGGPLPLPLPLFPRDNWWNTDISSAPVDPASAAFINFIGAARALHPDFGGNAEREPEIYGIPYVTVPGTQPLVDVTFEYADESDTAAPGRPPGYPIPPEVKTQPRWIEGGFPATGGDGDRHLLLVDRDNRILYELYATHWNSAAQRFEAGSGAIFALDSNARRPDGWTSADAAGLAVLPGLVRYDEAYGTLPIEHAFRVTLRSTNGYVFPASHRAGSTSGALPMGARLRLKASKDITTFPDALRRLFQAMKSHGLIVADNGSDMYVSGTYDTRWNNDLLNPAFRSLKASDFEVIQLGWKPASGPTCVAPVISKQPQSEVVRSGATTTLTVSAAGTAPLTYQWYRGTAGGPSQPVAGTTAVFVAGPIVASTAFWVRVTNSCGAVDSTTATISVRSRFRPVKPSGSLQ